MFYCALGARSENHLEQLPPLFLLSHDGGLAFSNGGKMMKLGFVAVASLGLTVFSAEAQAGAVMNISQVASDVVATASGTLNLGGLTFFDQDNGGLNAFVFPSFGAVGVGPAPSDTDIYTGAISGPATFGTGARTGASSGTGDAFVLNEFTQLLFVPRGYVSGSSLSGSANFADATLASLGITPGTYVYRWGSGANADTFTIDIATVPEPSTWAMMLVGFGSLCFAGYKRARGQRASVA